MYMRLCVPTVASEETEEVTDEADYEESDSTDDSSENEKSLDEIIDAYSE